MAGPTPVSALIHAATMVAAGVYLIGRLFEVFLEADQWVLTTVSIVAAITALGAALLAIVQDDIKRVLAYSTLSQPRTWWPASRSVSSDSGSSTCSRTRSSRRCCSWGRLGDPRRALQQHERHGRLRKSMVTFWTMLIGSLALAGIFPLAGFWSKDELLVVAEEEHVYWLFVVFLITAVITAFYTMRMVMLTFFGEYKGHAHPHESPATMTGPLVARSPRPRSASACSAPTARRRVRSMGLLRGGPRGRVRAVDRAAVDGRSAGACSRVRLYKERKAQDPLQAPMGPLERVPEPLLHRRLLHARDRRPVRDTWSSGVNWFNQVVLDAS